MIGLDPLVVADGFAHRTQWARRFASGDFEEIQAARAKAFGDAGFGKFGEILYCADAPAVEDFDGFKVFGGSFFEEGFDGEPGEVAAFFTGGDEVKRLGVEGGKDGDFRIGGDADLAMDAAFRCPAGDFAGDFDGTSDQADQGGDGEDDGQGVDLLDFGGEGFAESEQSWALFRVIRDMDRRVHWFFAGFRSQHLSCGLNPTTTIKGHGR